MKILVVEDDFASRQFLIRWLMEIGEVDVAISGTEALEAFSSALGARSPYDLVTLDIMMPDVAGTTVLVQMRGLESSYSGLPKSKMVMMTALSDPHTVKAAIQGQCDAYLVKPIQRAALFGKLKELGLVREQNSP
jgi:two-component system, chemotaxis family, chemotaxis protein CheY